MNTVIAETAINLDAIGRLGELFCKIAALSAATSGPKSATVEIVHDGARETMTGEEADFLAEELMDAKDHLMSVLREEGRAAFRTCMTALHEVYEEAGYVFESRRGG